MKKPLTLFQKILLSLLIVIWFTLFSDLLLQYFFAISLETGLLIIPLAIIGIASLVVFFPWKKLFVYVLCCFISGFVLIFYNLTQDGISSSRRSINESHYSIEVNPHSYSIIKEYDFAEKIVAVKSSTLFFDPNSKIAINPGYRVKILKETPDSLYIEINSRMIRIDSLKKSGLWDQNSF